LAEEKFVKPIRATAVHLASGGSVALMPGQPIALSELAPHVVEALESGDPFTSAIFEDSSEDEFKAYEAGLPVPPPKDFVRNLGSMTLPQANEAGEQVGSPETQEGSEELPAPAPRGRGRKKPQQEEEQQPDAQPEPEAGQAEEPEAAPEGEG